MSLQTLPESFKTLTLSPSCPVCGLPRKKSKIKKIGWILTCGKKDQKHNNYVNTYRTNKIKQTNLERYGVTNPGGLRETRVKIEQTNLERYGVTNPGGLPEIQAKIKQTNLERYGVTNPGGLPEIQAKIKQTNLERYNGSPSRRHYKMKYSKLSKEFIEKNFIDKKQYVDTISFIDMVGCSYSGVFKICKKFKVNYRKRKGSSRLEEEITSFLKHAFLKANKKITIIRNTRKIIAPLELDIFLPQYNIAIEIDGLYWHSLPLVEKVSKVSKFDICRDKGIDLITITDINYSQNKNKILRILLEKVKLKKPKKINQTKYWNLDFGWPIHLERDWKVVKIHKPSFWFYECYPPKLTRWLPYDPAGLKNEKMKKYLDRGYLELIQKDLY